MLRDSCVTSQLMHVMLLEAWELEKFQTAKVTSKVTQGHS